MKYFTNCKTIEEAKKLYRRLAMENHPDRGGDLDTMKAINAEYDEIFNTFKAQHNATAKTTGARPINETPEEFRQVIEKIINIPGIIIELCGSWIWISGETRAFKDQIKAAGCFWANKKKMWYWRAPEDAVHSRRTKSMDEIRTKYGSERIYSDGRNPDLLPV